MAFVLFYLKANASLLNYKYLVFKSFIIKVGSLCFGECGSRGDREIKRMEASVQASKGYYYTFLFFKTDSFLFFGSLWRSILSSVEPQLGS